MAVLVAQDHPDALRRIPSSGDGGIDLMVPEADGYEVRQVKRFTQRIGIGERRQIKQSWDTFRSEPRLSRPITAYRLVMPVDATSDEQAWFEELVADAPWPATWWGETHWHDLAARHPHVIDYFFGAGRDRVADRSRALQGAIIDPSHPLQAVDAAASAAVLQAALNRDDPHYRYDLRTSATPPPVDELRSCVLAQTRQLVDGDFLTVLVVPKHRYSLQDAPIGGTLTVDIPDAAQAAEFRDAFTSFEHFGRALDLPEGMVSGRIVAPGGIGGTFEFGGGWIGPIPTNVDRPPLRLVVVSRDGDVLGALTLKVPVVTTGPAGGCEIHLTDDSELFSAVFQIMPPPAPRQSALTFCLAFGDLTGRPVQQVVPVLRLLSYFVPPNELQLRPEYGNEVIGRASVPEGVSLVAEAGLIHLEDLATLQDYAARPLLVPEEINPPFASELHELVRMLRGEILTGSWDEVTMHLKPGVSRTELATTFAGTVPLGVEQEIRVDVDGQEIFLGPVTTILPSAKFADHQPDDASLARLVPADQIAFTRRAGRLPERPS
jgi:hypothetical protein